MIKGPLANAFVFLDENGNGLFDAGEPNFTTIRPVASISSSAANPKLIVTTNDQTIDTTTGTVLSRDLKGTGRGVCGLAADHHDGRDRAEHGADQVRPRTARVGQSADLQPLCAGRRCRCTGD